MKPRTNTSKMKSGLRNRDRNGKGPYHKKGKRKKADLYDRPIIDHPNHPNGARYGCCTTKKEVRP